MSIEKGWQVRAKALAQRTMTVLVNRDDVWGQYLAPEVRERTGNNALTRPPKRLRGKEKLSLNILEAHFQGKRAMNITGLHSTSPGNTSRWLAYDIDAHEGEAADPAANLEMALSIVNELGRYGIRPIVEDSNGRGGYHIWILFSDPVPTSTVFNFATSILTNLGFKGDLEVFPKQPGLGSDSLGNWLRLPGRHHGNAVHWSRFFVDGEWIDGAEAAEYWLNAPINDDHMVNTANHTERLKSDTATSSLSVHQASALLERLSRERADNYDSWIRVGQALHSVDSDDQYLAVWDQWSQSSDKYQPGECAKKWVGFNATKGMTVASLVAWANEDSPFQGHRSKGRRSDATDIRQLVMQSCIELWRTPDRTTFITLNQHERHHHMPIKSQAFERWIVNEFGKKYGRAPAKEARQSAIDLLDAQADQDGNEHHAYIRVASTHTTTYIDLADSTGRAVAINADGWQIVQNPPIRFQNQRGLRPLPTPVLGGTIDVLRRFLFVEDDSQWTLIVGAILAYLRGAGPFPILIFEGEQGSAKSTATKFIRAIVDPSAVALGTIPKDERDLAITSANTYLLTFDNVSTLAPHFSDAFCRLATGGGFRIRQLYTDRDEVLFSFMRPVVLNGIDVIASRADLRDRAITVWLPSIPTTVRRDEQSLWAEFNTALPSILGAFYTALSAALREIPNTVLAHPPRMADFARLATAAERGLGWTSGYFMTAYEDYLNTARSAGVDADLIARAICALVQQEGFANFYGRASELHLKLSDLVPDDTRRSWEWPKTPNWLANRLKRVAPDLRSIGIEIEFDQRKYITIRKGSAQFEDQSDAF